MRSLITFFLRNGLRSRRTLWMGLLGLFPVGCAGLLWLVRAPIEKNGAMLYDLFPQFSLLLFLSLLLPLMTLFVGTATIAEEVEDRTLSYLLVRPVPRSHVVLAKLAAGSMTVGAILVVSLLMSYTVLAIEGGPGAWAYHLGDLASAEGVILLGVLAYLPLFALMGGLYRRSVLLGLIFAFGWERFVTALPGSARFLTVSHYLTLLFPSSGAMAGDDGGARLLFGAPAQAGEPSSLAAVAILLLVATLFAWMTALLPSLREYRLEQSD